MITLRFIIAVLLTPPALSLADGFGCVEADRMEVNSLLQLYTTYAKQSLLFSRYGNLSVEASDRELMFNDCMVAISDRVIGNKRKAGATVDQYKKILTTIETLGKKYPDEMALLALNLQARWEDRYLVKFFQVIQNRTGYDFASRLIGYSTGLIFSARALVSPLSRVEGYFSLFTSMFGIQSAFNAGGTDLGELTKRVFAPMNIPPPPASLLSFGFNLRKAGIDQSLYSHLVQDAVGDQGRFASDTALIGTASKILSQPTLSIQARFLGWIGTLGLTYFTGNAFKNETTTWMRNTRLSNLRGHLNRRLAELNSELKSKSQNRRRILELAKKIGDYATLIEADQSLPFLQLLVAGEVVRSRSSKAQSEQIDQAITRELEKDPSYRSGSHPSVVNEIAREELKSGRTHESDLPKTVVLEMKRLTKQLSVSGSHSLISLLETNEKASDQTIAQQVLKQGIASRPDLLYRQLQAFFRGSNDPLLRRYATDGFSVRMKQYFLFYGGRAS